MNRRRIYERLGLRFGRILVIFSLFCTVLLAVFFSFAPPLRKPSFRTTMVIVANPMVILSWDRLRRTIVTIRIPSNVTIEGVHGYGAYSLEALWKLGFIDKSEDDLLATSLEEILGVPIPFFLGYSQRDSYIQMGAGIDGLKQYFRFTTLLSYLRGMYRSNIPLSSLAMLTWYVGFYRPDQLSEIDLLKSYGVTSYKLADGSSSVSVDPARLDILIGTLFEDERIRKEALRVAVYNTTQTSALGNRIARLLNHMGALVIEVGNSDLSVDRCIVSTKGSILQSFTVAFIARHYGCQARELKEPHRADIIVYVGKEYERRFTTTLRKKQ